VKRWEGVCVPRTGYICTYTAPNTPQRTPSQPSSSILSPDLYPSSLLPPHPSPTSLSLAPPNTHPSSFPPSSPCLTARKQKHARKNIKTNLTQIPHPLPRINVLPQRPLHLLARRRQRQHCASADGQGRVCGRRFVEEGAWLWGLGQYEEIVRGKRGDEGGDRGAGRGNGENGGEAKRERKEEGKRAREKGGLPPNCQNPDASRVLSSLKCVLLRHISRETSTVAIVVVPSLPDSSGSLIPSTLFTLHAPPPLVPVQTPGRVKKRTSKTRSPSQKHPSLPLVSLPHPPTTAPNPPRLQVQAQKETNPSSHPNSKSQDVRKARKKTGKTTYGLTLIRFSSAPSWSGMMISHSVFSCPASFSPSLSRPVAFVVVVVVDIWR